MLCECVPIVSHVASMPFIVADSGFILERKDLNMLKNLIQQALDSNTEELGKKARKRIADNFTEEKRAKDLIEAVESVLSN
jgi:glycosyltransferase involved in cell wall biosynthesis